jgi:CBS domain-containing protein
MRSLLPETPLPHLHPDQSLDVALRRLGDWPLLPIVNRADYRKLEGVVTLPDILEAYREVGPRPHQETPQAPA